MAKQLITVRPDGSLFGLKHKKGRGVDLTKFGKAKVKRVTLIEWDEDYQEWYIRWADSDERWTTKFIMDSVLPHTKLPEGEEIAYFEDYDDAVETEILVIQSLTKGRRIPFWIPKGIEDLYTRSGKKLLST